MNECVVCITILLFDVYHPSANADYRRFLSLLRFPAQVNEISFDVSINDDNRVENTEEFYIDLEIPLSSANNSVIKDPDSPTTTRVTITDGSSESCYLTYCTTGTVGVLHICMCHRGCALCIVAIGMVCFVSLPCIL